MKRLKIIIWLAFSVLLSTTASALSLPSGEYIWVDKGSYCIGDQIRISFYMPGTGDVKIWDHTPGGRTILIYSDEQEGKESTYRTMTARVEGPSGTETLEIEISEGCWPQPCIGLGWWTDSVSFFVEDCDPCRNVTCEPDCFGCDYWAMKCVDGDCVKDYIIERDSQKCGCGDPCKNVTCSPKCYDYDLWYMTCENGECVRSHVLEENSEECGYDPCKEVGKSGTGNAIVETLTSSGIGKLLESSLADLGLTVYFNIVKIQGGRTEMKIQLTPESAREVIFISSDHIAVAEGQTINAYLIFTPGPGMHTRVRLNIEYQETSYKEWETIASWEFCNSEFDGYFIGTGCIEHEIYLNNTTTPGYLTFSKSGEYRVKAVIQGASDELRVTVSPVDEDDGGACAGTAIIMILIWASLIHLFKHRSH